ncbi:MAG: helix-turn-helix domain-containing protein [Desulfobacterales bacterium]|nr:helix-turn-helix domain-containing protein [Desulfobacterales bacterium]
MNQGDFGAKAFGTSYESGRTKIKNIELGKQVPTEADLKKMARVLGVKPVELKPQKNLKPPEKGMLIPQKTLNLFSGLEAYLDMLNKAVLLGDDDLIEYISGKISELFQIQAREKKAVNA